MVVRIVLQNSSSLAFASYLSCLTMRYPLIPDLDLVVHGEEHRGLCHASYPSIFNSMASSNV
ncbi:hypothetical protein C5167_040904 [Papaver somniferum]|uniref:Uncharacterized protein n=1 Tax=Papaver somniferum TaxID=3469 RepID=A0A4Y7IGF6_PAPSO|nr:hypothetical protein C5167_040904 [Papaver somniferum]